MRAGHRAKQILKTRLLYISYKQKSPSATGRFIFVCESVTPACLRAYDATTTSVGKINGRSRKSRYMEGSAPNIGPLRVKNIKLTRGLIPNPSVINSVLQLYAIQLSSWIIFGECTYRVHGGGDNFAIRHFAFSSPNFCNASQRREF